MRKKKSTSKKPTKKAAAKKKAVKKASPKKAAAKKIAAKKKASPKGLEEYGRPLCDTHGYLGECMPYSRAERIIRGHEEDHHTCVVDVENC
jgi:hypothetical protein